MTYLAAIVIETKAENPMEIVLLIPGMVLGPNLRGFLIACSLWRFDTCLVAEYPWPLPGSAA